MSKHWKNVNSFQDLIKRSLKYSGMVLATDKNSICSEAGKQLRELFNLFSLISEIIGSEDILLNLF